MTTSHFDGIAEIYDETIPPHVARHYRERRHEYLAALTGQGPILDVGAGTGLLAELFADSIPTVGVDYSFEMIRRAPLPVRRAHASGAVLPFKTGVFSLVYTVATLHHLFDPAVTRAAITEMWRVVAPGGTLVIWDHNPLNPYWPHLMARVPQDAEPTRLVPLNEILEILRRAGARTIATRRWGWIPEFCPPSMLGTAVFMERLFESIPAIRELSAHNVVTARKDR